MASRSKLALRGEKVVLTVDPYSNELVNLYILDTELWKDLINRFGGNKMTVTLRGPHDLTKYLDLEGLMK